MLKIAFDIGGVMSKYPSEFRSLMWALECSPQNVQCFVITDIHPREKSVRMLRENGFAFIPESRVLSSDYETHGERCKQVILEEYHIDLFIDDHVGYLAAGGATVALGVWPNPDVPYWADEWITDPEDGTYGRRKASGWGKSTGELANGRVVPCGE